MYLPLKKCPFLPENATDQPNACKHGGHIWLNMAAAKPDQPCGRPQTRGAGLLEVLPRSLHTLPHDCNVFHLLQPILIRKI